MKDIRVTSKMRISDVLLYDKIKSFSFRWLRQVFLQLISRRKDLVSAANSLTQDHDHPLKVLLTNNVTSQLLVDNHGPALNS